ncbi:MAG: hypothetical protein R3A46_19825 [Thermomicrobiales bacterium]
MFSLDGEHLGQWNSRVTLTGLAIDDLDRLFVAYTEDTENNLQQLDIDGDFLVIRGGRAFGEHDFLGPAGVALRP